MFKILDGREHFFQWDLDRKLVIEDRSVKQVHFCNRTEECSLVCEPYEEAGLWVVNVPNILLQDIWRINVFAYDTNYTKHQAIFTVSARSKPESYVYTETEVLNFNTLLERINEVDEDIAGAVEDYLAENPIEVDLTGYATEKYVDEAIANIDIPETDLTGYATEKYVDEAIAAIELPETDLSNYYTKSEVDGKIPTVPTKVSAFDNDAGYLTTHQDLSGYALKSEIPDVSGYALKSEIPDVSTYQTEAQVKALITAELGVIENGTY